ncbi:hypothetical protein CL634_06235 [bacterium]|nr:hypothetical protein [bacterium]
MSKINLDTPDDVISFLKILAEESVKTARETIADPKQMAYKEMLSSDEGVYGDLDEDDDEESEEQPSEEAGVDSLQVSDQPEEEEETLEVSLDSISRAVKDLRSGRSVDDSRMKEQLRNYFDRLDEMEREALLAFMKAFSGILTGMTQGADAPDPSDPPYNISMSHGDEGEKEEKSVEPTASAGGAEEIDFSSEDEDEEDEPADQPPIKAGQSDQNIAEIRRRVKTLMNL